MPEPIDLIQQRINGLPAALASRHHLQRLGRLFSETVLIEVDGRQFYILFDKGRTTSITHGPSNKIPWRFALRTTSDALIEFWKQTPRPGYHDIFGLVKYGRARIEGDVLVLVKNLRFFKEFLALGRES